MAQRFIFLDGLRGLAAGAIVIWHTAGQFAVPIAAHAYLAVDFFFCLSGFVLAHAYDEALSSGRMTGRRFMQRRLKRLYPMVLISVVMALGAGWAVGTFNAPWEVALLTLGALTLLPLGLLIGHESFALNNPLWSLAFELAANAVYASRAKLRCTPAAQAVLLLLFGAALVVVAHRQHGLDTVGFSNGITFFEGFVRVAYPFYAGVIVHRCHAAGIGIPHRGERPALYLLSAVLLMPLFQAQWLYDAIVVLLVMPAIVALGANVALSARLSGIYARLGALSYPCYLLHVPILQLSGAIVHTRHPSTAWPVVAVVALAVTVLLSWACLRWIEPLLRNRLALIAPGTGLAGNGSA